MKLGIISDTHNDLEAAARAIKRFHEEKVNAVLHCGDWSNIFMIELFCELSYKFNFSVYGVFGNNDPAKYLKAVSNQSIKPIHFPIYKINELTIDNQKIVMYHGDNKLNLNRLIYSKDYNVVITGHTHKPLIQKIQNVLVINPGSTAFSIPRKKNFTPSVAIFDTKRHRAEIVFLGKL